MAEGAALTPGSRLGAYELLRPLAQGGMADIYLARLTWPTGSVPAGGFDRLVALKVLGGARSADAEARAMFLDEARLVALLDHPHIAAVHEVGVVDGKHFLAMEYVDGADLREVVAAAQRTGRPLPMVTSLSIVRAAAAGLDHAHRRSGPDGRPLELVHRDISLSNIMVGLDGAVKLIDFGIATTTIASVHTPPGVVRGKASYMSPEQCLGERVDRRSDVFALGVVLYELTTGARCFHGKTDFERMLAVVRGDYLAPSDLVASYPRDLEHVVQRALALDPERRFGSAAELVEALERVALAHGWIGGAGAVQRLMHALFGPASTVISAIHEPAALHPDDAPVTEPHSMPALLLAEPTRPERRLAGGTRSDCLDDVDDDLDVRTRGRGPLRRPIRSWLAA